MSSYCYEYSFSVVGRRSLSLRGEVMHRQGWEEMRNDEGGRHNANTMSESGIQLTLSCDGKYRAVLNLSGNNPAIHTFGDLLLILALPCCMYKLTYVAYVLQREAAPSGYVDIKKSFYMLIRDMLVR